MQIHIADNLLRYAAALVMLISSGMIVVCGLAGLVTPQVAAMTFFGYWAAVLTVALMLLIRDYDRHRGQGS